MNPTIETGMYLAAGVAIVYIVASVIGILIIGGVMYFVFKKVIS